MLYAEGKPQKHDFRKDCSVSQGQSVSRPNLPPPQVNAGNLGGEVNIID